MPPLAESWNQTGAVGVVTYTNCDSVVLYVNATKIGTEYLKNFPNMIMQWTNVPYQSGVIKAIGMKGGVAAAVDSIKTAGTPAKVSLKPDQTTLYADGNDVSCIEVDIADSNNTFIFNAVNQVQFTITGAGRSLGIASGDWSSNEPFKGTARKAYHGKVLIVVQSTTVPGTITVNVSSAGLAPSTLTLTTVPQQINTALQGVPAKTAHTQSAGLLTCAQNANSKNIRLTYNVDVPGNVSLSVVTPSGRMVNCLTNTYHKAGTYSTEWNAAPGSGIYFFVLKLNDNTTVRKAMVIQ
jgi:beta-galactosidase